MWAPPPSEHLFLPPGDSWRHAGLLRCRAASPLTPKVQGARSLLVWTLELSVLRSPGSWKACTHELAPWGPEPSLRHVSHWPECRPSPTALLLRSGRPAPRSRPPPACAPLTLDSTVCAVHPHAGACSPQGEVSGAAPTLPKSWTPPERRVRVLPLSSGCLGPLPQWLECESHTPLVECLRPPVPLCCRAQLSNPRPLKTKSLGEPRGRVLAGSVLEPWGLTAFPGE